MAYLMIRYHYLFWVIIGLFWEYLYLRCTSKRVDMKNYTSTQFFGEFLQHIAPY